MNFSPKILALIVWIASCACLGAGYAVNGPAAAVSLVPLIICLAGYRWPSKWLITTALLVSICVAAAGLLKGAVQLWMIIGAMLALAGWNLALFDLALSGSSSLEVTALLEKKHFLALGMVFGLGLLLVIAGRLPVLQIPLLGMMLLAALALFALERAWRSFTG